MSGESGPVDEALSDTATASPDTLRSQPIQPGDAVGRYVIVKRLGTGGMGSVYRARDPQLGRDVAIKLLHPHLADQRARLLGEGQAIARLAHRNVVAIHDVGEYRSGLFIAMELVEGTTLRGWLAAEQRPAAAVLDAFARAGAGLAAAHTAGIVHRDFKPDNVLVGEVGADGLRVVVTDFGLARAFGSEALPDSEVTPPVDATQTGAFTGTPLYMSPEQFTGGAIGAASDQFSFCIALYEALYRERPFAGTTVAAIMEAVTEHPPKPQPATPAIGARVRDALVTGLARDPAARHASMTALLAALAPPPPRRRSPARTLAIAAGAIAIAGGAIVVAATRGGGGSSQAPAAAIGPCDVATLRIDPLWTPAIRHDAAGSLGAHATAAADLAQTDAFVVRWKALRGAACRAGEAQAATATCLDHQLADLEQLPATWASNAKVGSHWPVLPDPDRCTRANGGEVAIASLHDSLGVNDNFEIEPSGARYAVEHDDVVRASEIATGTQRTFPVAGELVLQGWLDATHLVWRSKRTHRFSHLDLATGAWGDEPALPAPSDFDFIAAAPDWTELLGTSGGALVVAHRTAGGALEVLAPAGQYGEILSANWSPDRHRVATVQARRDASDPGNVELVVYERGAPPGVAHQRLRGIENLAGGYELAWPDPDHLVVEARVDPSEGGDLWLVGGPTIAAFARAPSLVLRAAPNTSYLQIERSGDRLLALEATQSKAIVRVVSGRPTPLPRTDNLRIADVTRDGKSLLVVADDQAQLVATADGTVTRLGHGIAHVHGDRVALYTSCAGGSLCIVERDPAAAPNAPPALVAPIAGFPKDITCSAGTCVEVAPDDRTESMGIRVLGRDDTFGPAIVLHHIERPADLDVRPAPDGKRVAVVRPFADRPGIDVFPLDGGPPVRWLDGDAHCYPTHSYWLDDATLFVNSWCSGASRVFEVQLGRPPRLVYATENEIGDLVVAADRTMYVAETAYVTKVVALTGL